MWNTLQRKGKASRIDTLIGQRTRILGAITFVNGLHIDGSAQGDVTAAPDSPSRLSLSKTGSIEGAVIAPYAALDGVVKGDVRSSEHVQLGSHARITGDVYYNSIEMSVGAEVNGKLVHTPGKSDRKAGKTGAGATATAPGGGAAKGAEAPGMQGQGADRSERGERGRRP